MGQTAPMRSEVQTFRQGANSDSVEIRWSARCILYRRRNGRIPWRHEAPNPNAEACEGPVRSGVPSPATQAEYSIPTTTGNCRRVASVLDGRTDRTGPWCDVYEQLCCLFQRKVLVHSNNRHPKAQKLVTTRERPVKDNLTTQARLAEALRTSAEALGGAPARACGDRQCGPLRISCKLYDMPRCFSCHRGAGGTLVKPIRCIGTKSGALAMGIQITLGLTKRRTCNRHQALRASLTEPPWLASQIVGTFLPGPATFCHVRSHDVTWEAPEHHHISVRSLRESCTP